MLPHEIEATCTRGPKHFNWFQCCSDGYSDAGGHSAKTVRLPFHLGTASLKPLSNTGTIPSAHYAIVVFEAKDADGAGIQRIELSAVWR